jgi:serine/threonine protein kinase
LLFVLTFCCAVSDMPPEYANTGHVSEKTDSFAFGIVLLELLTGLTPEGTIELHTELDDGIFEEAATNAHRDPRAGGWPPAVVRALAQVSKQCLRLFAKRRATVKDVLPMLEALEVLKGHGCS